MDALDEYEAWKKYVENEFEPNVETFRRMKREARLAQTVWQVAQSPGELSLEADQMVTWAVCEDLNLIDYPEEWWR